MCAMCGLLSETPHWSDPAARAGAPAASLVRARNREHLARLAPLNRVLRPFGIRASDWMGSAYVVQGPSGGAEVVADLGGVWPAAERVAGKRLDPLSPAFLDALDRMA